MRKLEFKNDVDGKDKYEVCTQAVLQSGRPIRPEEWDEWLPLKRKLIAIGVPSANQPKGAPAHRPMLFDLSADGVVELERGEYTLLLDLIKQPNWVSGGLEAVITTRNWLQGIKEYDSNGVASA